MTSRNLLKGLPLAQVTREERQSVFNKLGGMPGRPDKHVCLRSVTRAFLDAHCLSEANRRLQVPSRTPAFQCFPMFGPVLVAGVSLLAHVLRYVAHLSVAFVGSSPGHHFDLLLSSQPRLRRLSPRNLFPHFSPLPRQHQVDRLCLRSCPPLYLWCHENHMVVCQKPRCR